MLVPIFSPSLISHHEKPSLNIHGAHRYNPKPVAAKNSTTAYHARRPNRALPPEVIRLVLLKLVPAGSLVSALLASSHLHNVFENNKVSILSKVVRMHVHPSILLDAVTSVSPFPDGHEAQAEAQKDEEVLGEKEDAARPEELAQKSYPERYDKWLARTNKFMCTYLVRRKGDQVIDNLPLSVTVPLCRSLRASERTEPITDCSSMEDFSRSWI